MKRPAIFPLVMVVLALVIVLVTEVKSPPPPSGFQPPGVGEDVGSIDVGTRVEQNLEAIVSSPEGVSAPLTYIRAHQHEYESILKMGAPALDYLLARFEDGGNDNLKGHIMMSLCKELLGARNNVTDQTLSPQEWYDALSIRPETVLPDYEYDGSDPLEKLVYDTEVEMNTGNLGRGGFTVVAPKIHGHYAEGDRLKVFVTTYHARYQLFGDTLTEEGAGIIPAAITYRKDDRGQYVLEDYEQAREGAYWAPSIKDYCTLPVSGRKIPGLADRIVRHYSDYGDLHVLLDQNLARHLQKNGIRGRLE